MTRRTFALVAASRMASAETRQERGKRIIDQVLAALGGRNFLAMRDRTESGRAYSFYREQLSGLSNARIYTKYDSHPDPPPQSFFGIRERQTFGKKEDSAILFTEKQGFEITFRGARPLADNLIERYRMSTLHNIFYILRQRMGEPGLGFAARGLDVIENQPVEIVDIFDAENRTVTVSFNRDTWLPAQQKFYHFDAVVNDRREELTRFSKYHDVGGGVMWPMNLQRERDGEKIFELYSEAVTINKDLPDKLFALPAGIKLLKKEA